MKSIGNRSKIIEVFTGEEFRIMNQTETAASKVLRDELALAAAIGKKLDNHVRFVSVLSRRRARNNT